MRTDAILNLKLSLPEVKNQTGGKSFALVLDQVRAADKAPPAATKMLEQFVKNWEQAEQKSLAQLKTVAPQYKEFIQLQLTVNQLHLQTELMTKGAEAIGSTLRRLQQVGN